MTKFIKNSKEIKLMEIAGKILGEVHTLLKNNIKAGISLIDLDKMAHNHIISSDATPSFLGYAGFPCSICASVNDVLIHGIPNEYILKEGDLISVDVGVCYKGYHSDAAFSMVIGDNPIAHNLVKCAEECLDEALNVVKHNVNVQEIGRAVEMVAKKYGYHIPKMYCGHGIGNKLHQDPMILNYFDSSYSFVLKKGMTIAIEPMIIQRTAKTFVDNDD